MLSSIPKNLEIPLSADSLEDYLYWFLHWSTFHASWCLRAQWIENKRAFYNLQLLQSIQSTIVIISFPKEFGGSMFLRWLEYSSLKFDCHEDFFKNINAFLGKMLWGRKTAWLSNKNSINISWYLLIMYYVASTILSSFHALSCFFFFLIEVQLIHNVTFILGAQHSDWTTLMYYTLFTTPVVNRPPCHHIIPLNTVADLPCLYLSFLWITHSVSGTLYL